MADNTDTTMSNKKKPLLSDIAITTLADSYADFEKIRDDSESWSTHQNGYEFGANQTRATYEAELHRRDTRARKVMQACADALSLVSSDSEFCGYKCEAINHKYDGMYHRGDEPCPGIRMINRSLAILKSEYGIEPTKE